MIDADLAELYKVPTFRLNLMRRSSAQEPFPEDFMFQLTAEEAQSLTLQFVIKPRPQREPHSSVCLHRAMAFLCCHQKLEKPRRTRKLEIGFRPPAQN